MKNMSHLDLDHDAENVFGRPSTFEGQCILNVCAICGHGIWRTAERWGWSHSTPSRTARLADPSGRWPMKGWN